MTDSPRRRTRDKVVDERNRRAPFHDSNLRQPQRSVGFASRITGWLALRVAGGHAADGREVRTTVSWGVASGLPVREEGSQALYAAADAAMYHAKRAGRAHLHRRRSGAYGGVSSVIAEYCKPELQQYIQDPSFRRSAATEPVLPDTLARRKKADAVTRRGPAEWAPDSEPGTRG
jgi:hypothetical protein